MVFATIYNWPISRQCRDKIGVVGRNGAGKSTLAHALTGTDRDYTGQIMVDEPVSYAPKSHRLWPKWWSSYANQNSAGFERLANNLILDEPSSNRIKTHQQWLINQLQRFRVAVVDFTHHNY